MRTVTNMRNLSQYRGALFGIAALGVLLTHSTMIIAYPSFVNLVVSFGGVGVFIFSFLSGIGLYFSMGKQDSTPIHFYKRRFSRVGLSFLMISGVGFVIENLIFRFSITDFLVNITTLSFWINKSGVWYLSMLVPLYLSYPFFYRFIENGNRKLRSLLCGAVVLAIYYLTYHFFHDVYLHLHQVFLCLLTFILGNYYAKAVKEGKGYPKWLVAFSILFYPVRALIPYIEDSDFLANMSYGFLGIGLLFVAASVLPLLPGRVDKCLQFLGNISLELYLSHILLLHLCKLFVFPLIDVSAWSFQGQAFFYLTLVLFSIIISKLVVYLQSIKLKTRN